MEYIVEVIIIIGVIVILATTIKYPKDVGRTILSILLLPFTVFWSRLRNLLDPFEWLILFIEKKLEVNYLTKWIKPESEESERVTTKRKQINFQKFQKFIVVNSTSERIKDEILEADKCCREVNIQNLIIHHSDNYSVVETPDNGFFGYNFLIQWLTNNLNKDEIIGFATNGRTKFLTISDKDSENDMIGLTHTGQKFWVSMYDDLDKKEFLRIDDRIELNSKMTIATLDRIVQNA